MARVWKKPGDSNWWLDYTDNFGKRHRIRTTTESVRKAEDLLAEVVAQFKRRQLGLEVAPSSKVKTLDEAWKMWLEWCPPASLEHEKHRYNGNIKDSWLAQMDLAAIDGPTLDKWFGEKLNAPKKLVEVDGKRRTIGPQKAITVNGHRRVIRRIYNALIKKRLYRGVNPVSETTPLEEPERAYDLLTEVEFKRAVLHVNEDWADLCRVAFYTGLRRGELYALRKDRNVIDLERAQITPRASNKRNMVKGKKVKTIPLVPEALEALRRAWDAAKPEELLFPGHNGKMRTRNLRPADIIRSAMARAGMVEGWLHVCRWGCKVDQRHSDEQQRKCPKCSRILWPKAIVRKVRFHDLRHSTADHLIDQGVELSNVSQMLRHSGLKVTEMYRHRTAEHLRKAISPKTVMETVADLERNQSSEVAAILAEAREKLAKLALNRHQEADVVQLKTAGKAKI